MPRMQGRICGTCEGGHGSICPGWRAGEAIDDYFLQTLSQVNYLVSNRKVEQPLRPCRPDSNRAHHIYIYTTENTEYIVWYMCLNGCNGIYQTYTKLQWHFFQT
jgi:hypothetical protein